MCERFFKLEHRAEQLLNGESADVKATILEFLSMEPVETSIPGTNFTIHLEWAYIEEENDVDFGSLGIYYIIKKDDGTVLENGYFSDYSGDRLIESGGDLLSWIDEIWSMYRFAF